LVFPKGAAPEDIRKAQDALRESTPGVTEQPSPPVIEVRPGSPATTTVSPMPPVLPPPSPLPASKQQRLDDLLQAYRMDRISPQQYHTQRAKILAEP
jgi:hypothetical protein